MKKPFRTAQFEGGMVANEKLKPTYTPSLSVRLLWWFGIYLVPQLPLIGLIPFFYLFPVGLIPYFYHPKGGTGPAGPSELVNAAAYGFYLVHLSLSLVIPNKKVFIVLMIILLVIVCLNVRSCMDVESGLGQIKG